MARSAQITVGELIKRLSVFDEGLSVARGDSEYLGFWLKEVTLGNEANLSREAYYDKAGKQLPEPNRVIVVLE